MKDKKHIQLFLSATLLILFSCKNRESTFQCAKELDENEMIYQLGFIHSQEMLHDSSATAMITDRIKSYVADTVKYKVDIKKSATAASVEIYGIKNLDAVDHISCMLFSDRPGEIPENPVVFFYKDTLLRGITLELIAAVKRKNKS